MDNVKFWYRAGENLKFWKIAGENVRGLVSFGALGGFPSGCGQGGWRDRCGESQLRHATDKLQTGKMMSNTIMMGDD